MLVAIKIKKRRSCIQLITRITCERLIFPVLLFEQAASTIDTSTIQKSRMVLITKACFAGWKLSLKYLHVPIYIKIPHIWLFVTYLCYSSSETYMMISIASNIRLKTISLAIIIVFLNCIRNKGSFFCDFQQKKTVLQVLPNLISQNFLKCIVYHIGWT